MAFSNLESTDKQDNRARNEVPFWEFCGTDPDLFKTLKDKEKGNESPDQFPSADSLLPVSTELQQSPANQPDDKAQPKPPALGAAEAVAPTLPSDRSKVDYSLPVLPSTKLPDGFTPKAGETIDLTGTRITYATIADNKVKPACVEFPNQLRSNYKFLASGRVGDVTTSGADGKALCTIRSRDGVRYTIKVGDRTIAADAFASVSVQDDGSWTCQLVGQPRTKIDMRSDGTIIIEHPNNGKTLREIIEPGNRSFKMELAKDGKFHVVAAELKDGTQLTYSYDDNNRLRLVTEKPKFQPAVLYKTTDGGNTWEKFAGGTKVAQGKLAIDGEYRASFTESGGRKIEAEPNGDAPKKPREVAIASIAVAQKLAVDALKLMYDEKLSDAGKQVQTEWHAEIQKRFGKPIQLLPKEEQERLIADLNTRVEAVQKPIQAERSEKQRQLLLEMASLRDDRNKTLSPEALWSGPELKLTRELYKEYISRLEKKVLPEALRDVCGRKDAVMPANSPVDVPVDLRTGEFLHSGSYRTKAGAGEFAGSVTLKINPDLPPTSDDLDKIGRAHRWLNDVRRRDSSDRLDFDLSVLLRDAIQDNGLPARWLEEGSDKNKEGKRAALQAMIPFILKVKGYADAAFLLQDQLKIPLPPGCQAVTGQDGRKVLRYNWPPDATLDIPTIKQIEAYEEWLRTYGAKIEQALEAWGTDRKNLLFYGDIEGKAYAVLNEKGELVEIFDPPSPKDDPRVRADKEKKIAAGANKVNLFKSDFEVEERNGRFFVKATMQACDANFGDYLNIGAKKVGKVHSEMLGPRDANNKPLGFERGAVVAIRDATGKITLKPVEELASLKSKQWFLHNGHKVVTTVMDVTAVGAAVLSGGTAALAWGVSRRAALGLFASATGKLALFGSSFLLTNARANSDTNWRMVNEARGVIMVAHMASGPAKGLLGFGGKSRSALELEQKVATAAEKSNWLFRTAHGISSSPDSFLHKNKLLKAANIGFGFFVARDISLHVEKLRQTPERNNPFDAARRAVRGGRDYPELDNPDVFFAKQDQERRENLFASYMAVIVDRKALDPKARERIEEISRRTRELINPEFPPELTGPGVTQKAKDEWLAQKKKDLVAELMDEIYGPRDKLVQDVAATGDPGASGKTKTASGFVSDRDVKLAASAALLMLSLKPDGSLPDNGVIGSRDIVVPGRVTAPFGVPIVGERPPVRFTQEVSLNDMVAFWKSNEVSESASTRMLVGDLLVKTGERTPLGYATVLKDVLNSRTASDSEKLVATSQLAEYIFAMRAFESENLPRMTPEDRIAFLTESYGATAADLAKLLADTAASPSQSKNIRGFATAILAELDCATDVESLQEAVTERAKECSAFVAGMKPGSYDQVLRKEMEDGPLKKDDEIGERLNAALALRRLGDLGPYSGTDGQQKFNKELLEIAKLASSDPKWNRQLKLVIETIDPKALDAKAREELVRLCQGLLSTETKAENSELKTAIVKRAGEFADTQPQKEKLAQALISLCHPPTGPTFAKNFPLLRADAIAALATVDTTGKHAEAIAKCATPPGVGKPHEDYEPDAAVRLAAIGILSRWRSPELDKIMDTLLAVEKDFAVRAKLMECKVGTYRPVRDFAYTENISSKSKIMSDNFAATRAGADDFLANLRSGAPSPTKDQQQTKYRVERRLLYRGKQEDVYENVQIPNGTTTVRVEDSAYMDHIRRNLFDKAKDVEGGRLARVALIDLVLNQGKDFPEEWGIRQKIVDQAVAVLVDLCKPGSQVRKDILPGIREILLNCHDQKFIPIKSKLIDGIISQTHGLTPEYKYAEERDAELGADFRTDVGNLMSQVMESEFLNHTNQPRVGTPEFEQREKYRMKLLELVLSVNSFRAFPILDTLARASQKDIDGFLGPKVHSAACFVLAQLRDSVIKMWDSPITQADLPMDKRVELLKKAVSSSPNENGRDFTDIRIRDMFSAVHGMPIKSQDDPRISYVRLALSAESKNQTWNVGGSKKNALETTSETRNGSQQISLAAALVMLKVDDKGDFLNPGFTDEDRNKARELCARLCFMGCEVGYRNDAFEMLQYSAKSREESVVNSYIFAWSKMFLEGNKVKNNLWNRFEPGEVIEQKQQDGTLLRVRVADHKDQKVLIIEEFKDGKLTRACTGGLDDSPGLYNEVLSGHMAEETDPTKQRELCLQVLTKDPRIQPPMSETQRTQALSALAALAKTGSDEFRLDCATKLCELANLASSGEKALAHGALQVVIDLAASGNGIATEKLKSLPLALRPDSLLMMGRATSKVAESATDNKSRLVDWLELLNELTKDCVPGKEVDAAILQGYLEGAQALGLDHPTVAKFDLAGVTARFKSNPFVDEKDPRLQVLDARGNLDKSLLADRLVLASAPLVKAKYLQIVAEMFESVDLTRTSVVDAFTRVMLACPNSPALVAAVNRRERTVLESLSTNPLTQPRDKRTEELVMYLTSTPGRCNLNLVNRLLFESPNLPHNVKRAAWEALSNACFDVDNNIQKSARDMMARVSAEDIVLVVSMIATNGRRYNRAAEGFDFAIAMLEKCNTPAAKKLLGTYKQCRAATK